MKFFKWSVVLLALLLAAMAMLPIVSAETASHVSANDEKIVILFAPIDSEIQEAFHAAVIEGKNDLKGQKFTDYSEKLLKKYQKNLDLILDALEKETGIALSTSDRENMKRIIVQEHMGKVSWEKQKEKLGVKDSDFKTIFLGPSENQDTAGGALLYMPNSLTLIQVSADVYGGSGFDGGWRPYSVNGGNQLYRVDWNSGSGWALYQCRFYDEDVPSPAGADATYDAYRLAVYGTIEDTQGFYIYNNNQVEFGNDYDNGNTYGTVVGQHGYALLPWSTGTPIYISNVWNHAMSTTDRNSNMAKVTYYY
jgi:hypothetical protein